jgi:putative nucleotidyltransferase with HDIG domain
MSVERILVIDDEPPIRDVVCVMLQAAGYRTVQASSGADGMAILKRDPDFQLVLSDLMMPHLDGTGLLENIRRDGLEMPVVMVTAVHDISVALAAIRNGAYDYLLKPFEREQLLAVVRRALEAHRLRVENLLYQSNLESLVDSRTRQLRETITQLEASYDVTLEALGDALDLKDAETEGHSKRVTAYTIEIGRALGLAPESIRSLARGAFLHDIGKMAIPDAILLKPERLTTEETRLMREHSYLGYRMLRKIPYLVDAADIVFSHQERWDGSGYPRGLKGTDIPIGARVFAIADTLDAITSDRPYRPARSMEEARDEIQQWSGRQFDPEIVKVFLSMPPSTWEELRAQIRDEQTYVSYTERMARPSPYNVKPPKDDSKWKIEQIDAALQKLPGWRLDGRCIERELSFGNFLLAIKFINRLAEVAEQEGHHPNVRLLYNRVILELTTHDAEGLTDKDFRMAERINALLQQSD